MQKERNMKKKKKPKKRNKNLFGQAIEQIMEHKGMTAFSLAKAAGIPNPLVYRSIKGESLPSFKTFFKLSKALGYKRPDRLLTEICNIIEYLHEKEFK